MTKQTPARPIGITALIVFFVAGTLISFLAGVSLLFPSSTFRDLWRLNPDGYRDLLGMGVWALVLLFSASASCAITAAGLLKRARWGHILAIVLVGINLLSDIVNTVLGTVSAATAGIPIALLIILYLLTKRVRTYFV